MSGNIPFEMQIEIMKRLPAKSLAVSRSVSKAWKSVIDSPVFITDYTNLHEHHRVLIRYDVDTFPDRKFGFDFKYVSVMDNDSFPQHDTLSKVPESFERLLELLLVGMSQGLFCVYGKTQVSNGWFDRTAVIWNPSIGKYIAIDVPHLYTINQIYVTVLGFGVRPDNCDPTIVMINHIEHPYPVLVFTLSSRVWRVPRGNVPPKSIHFAFASPVAATDTRFIYWKTSSSPLCDRTKWCCYCCCSTSSPNLVVAFDMVSEDFTEINLPHSVAHRRFEDFSISKIKESLALIEYCGDAEKPVYGVWMMVKDGVSNSFTKLFTVNTPDTPLVTKVLGFRKNGQPIMETGIDEFVEDGYGVSALLDVYEPRTGTIKEVGINGERDSFFLASYTETLLLLDQLDEQFVEMQLQLEPSKLKRYKHLKARRSRLAR